MSREMVNSGIPWIGDIPKGWDIDTIGNLYTLRNEKVSDKDYPPLSVTKIGIVPQLETAAKTDDGDNRKLVRIGDFAINSRSDRRGSCGISAYDGSVSLINTVITPREQMNPRFYNWLFHSELFADEFYKWGHGIVDDLWTTRWQEMKRISIVAPSLEEQQKIASFLDGKCSEIDEMIALQEKIVEELNAYKQSVITEAVTKGLNTDVPMKDSGVEWIGEIPEHWRITTIGRLFRVSAGGDAKWDIYSDKQDNEHPYPVYTNTLDKNQTYAYTSIPVYKGDTITVTGRGDIGRAFYRKTPFDAIIRLLVLEKRYSLDCRYFAYFINNVIHFFTNSAAIGQLSAVQVVPYNVCHPSIEEQTDIADYLDTKCTEIDNLISIKLSKIDSLKEYKKSIIYEYVTGKKEVIE